MHSHFSDGRHTPEALVERIAATRLTTVALTDHDTLDGIEPFVRAAKPHGIRVVSGAEVTCRFEEREIHLLAYGFDPTDADLRNRLEAFRKQRLARLEKIVAKLERLGVAIDLDGLLHDAGPGSVGRPHIAKALVDQGVVKNIAAAFERYLGRGRPAYVARQSLDFADAVILIREAGGVAVMAHPGHYFHHTKPLKRMLSLGLGGIEVEHPVHSPPERQRWRTFAQENDLLVTGGSDYHGHEDDGRDVGCCGLDAEAAQQVVAQLGM